MADVIAKNFNTVINVIQSHENYDMIHLKHLHGLFDILQIMVTEYGENVNLYSENNKTLGSFRDAGLDINEISNKRGKLFPILSPWQMRDVLDQLEPVLMFTMDLKNGVFDDFRVNNLFTTYKINNVSDLINNVHSYLINHYRFYESVSANFSVLLKDGAMVDSVIKRYKKKKYLDETNRNFIKSIINKYLVYEISFNFSNLGLKMNSIKNF
nr:hypothetical 26kDA protein [Urdbean crinivirus]